MKEAYRKNKHILYDSLANNEKRFALVMIYISKEKMDYLEMENKLIAALNKLKIPFIGWLTADDCSLPRMETISGGAW